MSREKLAVSVVYGALDVIEGFLLACKLCPPKQTRSDMNPSNESGYRTKISIFSNTQ